MRLKGGGALSLTDVAFEVGDWVVFDISRGRGCVAVQVEGISGKVPLLDEKEIVKGEAARFKVVSSYRPA
jgi:hypothetical protein